MSTSAGSSMEGAHMPKAAAEQMVAPQKSDSLRRRLSCGGAANAACPPRCTNCTSAESGLSQLH
eukprot:8972643-Alexandrium_andersonii.AAC.1